MAVKRPNRDERRGAQVSPRAPVRVDELIDVDTPRREDRHCWQVRKNRWIVRHGGMAEFAAGLALARARL